MYDDVHQQHINHNSATTAARLNIAEKIDVEGECTREGEKGRGRRVDDTWEEEREREIRVGWRRVVREREREEEV